MKVIGITGGIGTGKSTVSEYLRNKGYRIIDADEISRSMTRKGSPVLDEIAEAFGPDMIGPDGELLRQRMAQVVFSDPVKKEKLERIVTDRVVEETRRQADELREQGDGLGFLDAPLLFEAGCDRFTDGVWLVTADPELRIQRVMERDQCSREQVMARMANQMPEEEKRKRSTEILDNSGDLDDLLQKIDALLAKYHLTKGGN